MLGRDDATMILERVALLAERSPDPTDIARGARAERALGRLREANASYQLAANRAPTDPAINTAWGELFLQTEQNSEALKSFQAVVQADARWAPALFGAAQALADDDPPQAVALAKKVLEINPSSVDAYVFLAGQATDADKRSEGRQLLQKALAINPKGIDPNYFYGEYLVETGKPRDAVAYLERAVDAPARPGREVADAGRRDEAKALLDKARSEAK
jgi:Tfp pilus assembly protein PilF